MSKIKYKSKTHKDQYGRLCKYRIYANEDDALRALKQLRRRYKKKQVWTNCSYGGFFNALQRVIETKHDKLEQHAINSSLN